jgi:preprotein translocase subunit SecD
MAWIRLAGLAATLVFLAGCGEDGSDAACVEDGGGTTVAYEARGASATQVERAVDLICERLERLGVSGAALRSSGRRITAEIPRGADRAAVEIAFSRNMLAFYDWEPNVVDPQTSEVLGTDRAVTPEGAVVTNRPIAGSTGLYQAVKAASEAEPVPEATDIPAGGPNEQELRAAGVDPADEPAVREFYDRRNDASSAAVHRFGRDRKPIASGATTPAGGETIEVPQGIVVLEAERAPTAPENAPRTYFVIEDDVELDGSDIENPEQNTDRFTDEPVVTMDFSEEGDAAFAKMTRQVAERGALVVPPPPDIERAFQRFAITLANRIVSLATIDFRTDPEGIDGRAGAQIAKLGSLEQTQALAAALALGPLPVDLEPVTDG